MGKKKDKFVEWANRNAETIGAVIGYTAVVGLPVVFTIWAVKHDQKRAEGLVEEYNEELDRQRGVIKTALESGARVTDTPLGNMITYADGSVEFV